jgi:hypothetical protein
MWHESTQSVLIDTDIGDDIDDAFALALALRLPWLRVRGVTTVAGPVQGRARLAQIILAAAGCADVPVAPGSSVMSDGRAGSGRFSQQPILEIENAQLKIENSAAHASQFSILNSQLSLSAVGSRHRAINALPRASWLLPPASCLLLPGLTRSALARERSAWRECGWPRAACREYSIRSS